MCVCVGGGWGGVRACVCMCVCVKGGGWVNEFEVSERRAEGKEVADRDKVNNNKNCTRDQSTMSISQSISHIQPLSQ